MTNTCFEKYLKVGVIQPIVNETTAWPKDAIGNTKLQMNNVDAHYIKGQIERAISAFMEMKSSDRPNIILLPELCIRDERSLELLAQKSNILIVSGLDFRIDDANHVRNIAGIYIPSNWNASFPSTFCQKFHFGKKFFSHPEKVSFGKFHLKEVSNPNLYILNTLKYGRIGFAICADFFDISRFLLYKGKIQHLFVLALNKDTETFEHLAETISRLVFCNVVVSNTGHYGGSLAYSPYKDVYKRFVYLHKGCDLYTSQVVSLPVSDLIEFQKGNTPNGVRIFKSTPPGYNYPYEKRVKITTVNSDNG